MPSSTFTVFLDEDAVSQSASNSNPTSSRKVTTHDSSAPATKENINPLTGQCFDTQPPLKRRKPSSSSALKAKSLSSSSKATSKHKKVSITSAGKDKGKKRTVLGAKENKNAAVFKSWLGGEDETEQLRTSLGNRRAYEFTVMPLANVTQAYDETEAMRAMTHTDLLVADESQLTMGTSLEKVTKENHMEICDETSKEAIPTTVIAVEA